MSSSLAGALDDPLSDPYHRPVVKEEHEDENMYNDSSLSSESPKIDEVDETMDDLFGNDRDVEVSKRETQNTSSSASGLDSDGERLPSAEKSRRKALEYEEEELPQDVAVEVKEAHVMFPNLPVPRSSTNQNWVIRIPNYVKVDSKPFHPYTYIGPEHEDEELHAESLREKSMTIKLKVENTLRWRWVKDALGHDIRQSNSRIIRWSDGTLSLRLGKELFDVVESVDNSAGVTRQHVGTIPSSQQQSQFQTEPAPGKSQGLTYLVAQHKRSQVLQSEAIIVGHMSLRPTGMQSETHRMLVRAVGQKHNKVARLRMAPEPIMDPEREKMELMKQNAKKSKTKNEVEDGFGTGRKKRYSRRTANRDVWSDDDDDADMFAGFDEGVNDVGESAHKAKRKEGEDAKGPEDYQEDDFVVADSSDEEGGSGRRRKREQSDMDEEDPLDKLEAKIQEQQKKRKVSDAPKGGDESDENNDNQEVESEEDDEEESQVRRLGSTGTRKRAPIRLEEDEEEEE